MDTVHAAGQVEDSYAETDRCTLSLDVRDIQSILQSKDHHSKLQVKGVAGTQNRSFNSELVVHEECAMTQNVEQVVQ